MDVCKYVLFQCYRVICDWSKVKVQNVGHTQKKCVGVLELLVMHSNVCLRCAHYDWRSFNVSMSPYTGKKHSHFTLTDFSSFDNYHVYIEWTWCLIASVS